jgi:hypothetical protein
MRFRQRITTRPNASSTYRQWDLKFPPNYVDLATFVNPYVDYVSYIWDDDSHLDRFRTKSVTHLKWSTAGAEMGHSAYHSSDTSNVPNPRYRFDNICYPGNWYKHPSSDYAQAGSYIPVSGNTSNDIDNCVFNAYHSFISGVQALDASQSIAEIGETPSLFNVWQRRKGVVSNATGGFLNYSFGWRPVISDLKAIAHELRSFPSTVRKRLAGLGNNDVVRHFSFDLTSTVNDLTDTISSVSGSTYAWQDRLRQVSTVSKSRKVVVTIRAKVKPKLGPEGQAILDKLGALGLIPSLGTLWAITRLSFVVDWFYNIGGAIENLQGCLTHDITDVRICVSDKRTRTLDTRMENTAGPNAQRVYYQLQTYYSRFPATVPLLPAFRYPRSPMKYALLGVLTLTNTKAGGVVLRTLDGLPISKRVTATINAGIARMSASKQGAFYKAQNVLNAKLWHP